jgi:hypothetical protein
MLDALKVGLLAPVLLLAFFVALIAEPDDADERVSLASFALECATGEAAENPLGPDGAELARQEFLDTIDEAEAFLCVDVPEIEQVGAWGVRQVNALRSAALSRFSPGEWTAGERAYKSTETYYGNDELLAFLTLAVYPGDLEDRIGVGLVCGPPTLPNGEGVEEFAVKLQGIETTLWIARDRERGQPLAAVCWARNDLTFYAGVSFQPGFDVQSEILPLLNSIE